MSGRGKCYVGDDIDLEISLNAFKEVVLTFLKKLLKHTITGLILQQCGPLTHCIFYNCDTLTDFTSTLFNEILVLLFQELFE